MTSPARAGAKPGVNFAVDLKLDNVETPPINTPAPSINSRVDIASKQLFDSAIVDALGSDFQTALRESENELQPVCEISKVGEYIRVKCKKTTVLATAQYSLAEPYPDAPATGKFALMLFTSQMTRPLVQAWKPRIDDKTLGRIIARGLRQSLDLQAMRITEEMVGALNVDIQVYSADSNLLDIAYFAGDLAIRGCKKPEAPTPAQEGGEKVSVPDLKLGESVAVTVVLNAQKVIRVINPALNTGVYDRFTIAFDDKFNVISAVKHYSGRGVKIATFRALLKQAEKRARRDIQVYRAARLEFLARDKAP